MNSEITRTFLFIGLFISVTAAKAQPRYWDYVITIKGDSIRCNVEKPFIGRTKYKSATMGKPEKITIENIKEYSLITEQKTYRAVNKDSSATPMFMTVIEKGKIGLYELINTSTSMGFGNTMTTTSTRDWYIGKNSDYVTGFKSSGIFLGKSRKSRKDLLGEMFKDKPEIYNKYMADDKFSFKQIQRLIHLYNTGQELKEE
ncbi:hypothetical protein [Mucilaginibacter sp.]|uniref:hypothetical protein n=1 Tax=Mucilaginibacter sp. TaxID=1882438 RepID=UPI0025F7670E|nr:hypothetical protein [Mucilaginibacter sp.]